MKNKYTLLKGFTLIEIVIAITIFGIIMVSVLSIFLFSSQMSSRVEMNRILQENIKNITEDIAETMRQEGLSGVLTDGGVDDCVGSGAGIVGTKLCLRSGTQYTIGRETTTPGEWIRSTNIIDDCGDITDVCRILKKDPSGGYYPLSNSFTHFENISFIINNDDIPQLFLHMTVRPSIGKGILIDIVKNTKIHIQTSLSERIIQTQ